MLLGDAGVISNIPKPGRKAVRRNIEDELASLGVSRAGPLGHVDGRPLSSVFVGSSVGICRFFVGVLGWFCIALLWLQFWLHH